ncbi:hypothetical protein AWC26_19110 [Mycobacterium shimoidei]|nr:hypothetical protein AWC26_19110 [Mycobacterium shimoidei]
MFERRKLRKVGARASAEVITAEQSAISVSVGNPNLVANNQVRWKLQLRVMPDNEPPFEAGVAALFPQLSRPRPGLRLRVLYDPKNHSRVELDHEPVAIADTAIDAITASRPDLADAHVMGMPMTDVIRAAIADPDGFRAEMMRRGAQMQEQALADAAVLPAVPESDPVERLERLGALKDRGMLTDAEFDQQKRKILGD